MCAMDGEVGSRPVPAGVRVSQVVRTPVGLDRATSLGARVLDDAMHALGLSNCQLGDYLGCDEATVRAMRRGKKSLTAARIIQLPPSLRADVLRRVAAVDEGGPMAPTREMQVSVAMAAAGRVITACASASMDGRVTETEVHDLIGPELAAFDRAAEPLRAPGGAR